MNPHDGNVVQKVTCWVVGSTENRTQFGVISLTLKDGIGLLEISRVVTTVLRADLESL